MLVRGFSLSNGQALSGLENLSSLLMSLGFSCGGMNGRFNVECDDCSADGSNPIVIGRPGSIISSSARMCGSGDPLMNNPLTSTKTSPTCGRSNPGALAVTRGSFSGPVPAANLKPRRGFSKVTRKTPRLPPRVDHGGEDTETPARCLLGLTNVPSFVQTSARF